METPTIQASSRDRIGTRYARRLRQSGRLPAVIYGHKQDPVAVSIDEKEVLHHLHHGARLFTVTLGGKQETCLVKDLQFGFLGDDVIHVDFARVDLTEEVELAISIHFLGEPVGLKEPGAILRTVNDSVEVRCQAGAIPDEISLNISELQAGHHLTAGDITMPAGVTLVTEPDRVLCRITVVQEMEEEELAGEALAEGVEGITAEGEEPEAGDAQESHGEQA